jgi:NAD(P)-dependent dehydrogenase (short-subunit alcohol dehydrogenase family)
MGAGGDRNANSVWVALVTGASRGVGRGIAQSLAQSGMAVYVTGRGIERTDLPRNVVRVTCDHCDDAQVAAAFAQIEAERGRLDILVNNAWGGYEKMVEDGEFTWNRPFWLQPLWRWDAMMSVGVRGALVASQHAARMMIRSGTGLIVNLSYWAAQKYLGNALYGCAKAATDKLSSDMARELAPYGISVISLYPGLVRTEAVMAAAAFLDLSNSESPEFIGRAIHALACDPLRMRRSGQVQVAAQLALDYGFTDIDGRQPRPLSVSEA